MMAVLRPDLDGFKIRQENEPAVWLIFHGKRHTILNPTVYNDLFTDWESVVSVSDAGSIAEGHVLTGDTRLMRVGGDDAIYLVTSPDDLVVRHSLADWHSFIDFGFREAGIVIVPRPVLNLIPHGPTISSAKSRIAASQTR